MSWQLSKKYTRAICDELARNNPNLYVLTMSKSKRRNKIFLDYLRNTRGATAVAPYSPRANSEASVSLPISWQDVKKNIKADAFDIKSALKNLKNDPWKNYFNVKQIPHRH
jgi:bifunctional non-homologous end joining protein LigD